MWGKKRWADDNEQTKPVIALGNDRSSFTERAIRDTCRKGKDVFTLCSSGTTLCCRPYERCTEDELGEIFQGRSRKRKQTSNKHHSLRPTGKHTVMVRNVVPLSWTAQCSWKEASIVSPTRRMRQYEKNIGLWGNRKKKTKWGPRLWQQTQQNNNNNNNLHPIMHCSSCMSDACGAFQQVTPHWKRERSFQGYILKYNEPSLTLWQSAKACQLRPTNET